MLDVAKKLAGKKVKMTYIPVPYLGTGITEPIEVVGVLSEPRTMMGRNYVAISENGKTLVEKDVMDIQTLEEVASGGVENAAAPVHDKYQRASR